LPEPSQAVAQQRVSREFTFPGDSDSLAASRQAVMDFIGPHCSSDVEELDIFIALQEALANAVLHGSRNDPAETIHCRVEIDPSAFLITIRDPGPGFDVEAATRATEFGANTTTHGRGIAMMRDLMDEVVYRNGGSEVELRKLRAA
jgi:anti-sigma regulatory factor (Ser/Thr protein kinase)